MRFASTVITFYILLWGCATSPESVTITRSDGTSRPPELSADRAVYQRFGSTNGDSLVRVFLARGLRVVDLWNPTGGSPCGAMDGTHNVIVRLLAPDLRIQEYGFDSDPGWMIVNCGVRSFEHYHVQR